MDDIINDDFLQSIGLGDLSADKKQTAQQQLQRQLQVRLGLRFSELLDAAALRDFQEVAQNQDQATAEAWLQQHLPMYKQLVQLETEDLRQEIIDGTQAVLKASD